MIHRKSTKNINPKEEEEREDEELYPEEGDLEEFDPEAIVENEDDIEEPVEG